MEPFAGIAHEDLLKLLISLALLLSTALILGQLMRRIGQPAILGELLAGVLLGPALLAGAFPWFEQWVVPTTAVQAQLLDVVALLGVLFLILVVGMETDIALIRRHSRAALSVGFSGFVVPFALGLGVASLFPDRFLEDTRLSFTLFLATALALSAIPVLAKILSDLRLFRTGFGQVALAAGMLDDLIGWTLLGMITSIASAGRLNAIDAGKTIGALAIFFAASYWIARPGARVGLRFLQHRLQMYESLLGFVIAFGFLWAAFSQALHLEPVLGAFVAGIVLGSQRRLPTAVTHQLETVTMKVFAPIFLAVAGLRLDIEIFLDPQLLGLTLVLILVASIGKVAGCFVGARVFSGYDIRQSLGFGAALNARGVLGIIVAVIGQSMGIFGPEVYAMIVVTSLATSLIAPVALKRLMSPVIADEESDADRSRGYERALMPLRMRSEMDDLQPSVETSAVARILAPPPSATLMTVVDQRSTKAGAGFLDRIMSLMPADWDLARRVVTGDPAAAILDEAGNGYDLIVLGASERQPDEERLFDPVVDTVTRLAPCDTLIVSRAPGDWPPQRILVPTGGGAAAGRAAELAFLLADESTEVVLFHVLDPDIVLVPAARDTSLSLSMDIAQAMLADLRERGERLGVTVSTETVAGPRVVDAILERASHDTDLVVIGTHVRVGSPRLYLGPKVDRLLHEAVCATMVLNASSSQAGRGPA